MRWFLLCSKSTFQKLKNLHSFSSSQSNFVCSGKTAKDEAGLSVNNFFFIYQFHIFHRLLVTVSERHHWKKGRKEPDSRTAEITLQKCVQGGKKSKIMYQKFSLLGVQLVLFCGRKYLTLRYLIVKKQLPQSQWGCNIGKKEHGSGTSQKLWTWTLWLSLAP